MKITNRTTLEEILRQPWAKGWEYMVDPGVDPLLKKKLGDNCQQVLKGKAFIQLALREIPEVFPAWNVSSLVDGLAFLEEKTKAGPVFHHIWSEEERSADPSKEHTGISAFPADGNRPFFIICPGGGYSSVCAIAEGFPVAMQLNRLGYSSFVLQYRYGAYACELRPEEDLAAALRFILNSREQFGIKNTDFALAGFSAGAHLAGLFASKEFHAVRFALPSPSALFLGYPVVTMGAFAHEGSRTFFTGGAADPALLKQYSVENLITKDYPATFLWQCEEDDTVPAENSKMLYKALQDHQVRVKYETYPGTAHGWGPGTGTPADGWLDRAVRFAFGS